MPTGYTAPVVDGEMTSPADFILNCARAFGALVTLRDSPDAPIPDELKPSTYHAEQAEKAKASLVELEAMPIAEAEEEARRQHRAATARWSESKAKTEEVAERLAAMRTAIEAWEPPTPEHVSLKDFMLQQLDETLRIDGTFDVRAPRALDGGSWLADRIATAKRDIEYHAAQQDQENRRVAERNGWLAALRSSLPEPMGVQG